MNDYVVSLIRTWVPLGVGSGLTWLATETGIVLDEQTSTLATTGAVALVTALYYTGARAVEQRWPRTGRALLALGLTGPRTPAYQLAAPRNSASEGAG
jgi:hypothetical protein